MRRANVIVTTMQVVSKASPECQMRMGELATHLFVDEAHHIAAKTWAAFRANFTHRTILQFTATPFRTDGRSIGGKFIYVYPLRRAQQEELFRPITFEPIQGADRDHTDDLIIAKLGEVLARDRAAGLKHLAMARVADIPTAERLHCKYASRLPQFNPTLIHSEMTRVERATALAALRSDQSRIIVCVDMLGEAPRVDPAFHDRAPVTVS